MGRTPSSACCSRLSVSCGYEIYTKYVYDDDDGPTIRPLENIALLFTKQLAVLCKKTHCIPKKKKSHIPQKSQTDIYKIQPEIVHSTS